MPSHQPHLAYALARWASAAMWVVKSTPPCLALYCDLKHTFSHGSPAASFCHRRGWLTCRHTKHIWRMHLPAAMWVVNFCDSCSALSVAFILSSSAVSLQGVADIPSHQPHLAHALARWASAAMWVVKSTPPCLAFFCDPKPASSQDLPAVPSQGVAYMPPHQAHLAHALARWASAAMWVVNCYEACCALSVTFQLFLLLLCRCRELPTCRHTKRI
jgi:hypothetical protein